jgi:hypothetical protein
LNSITRKLAQTLSSMETRLGLLRTSFVIGLFLLAAAMFYVQPNFVPEFLGHGYSELSKHPLDLQSGNPLQYRILAPLLGYLIFLRGDLFFILPLLFAVFFISAIYFQYRKKKFSPIEAFIMTLLVAFSGAVLIPLIAPGYTDTITFFFLFLSFAYIRKIFHSAMFFGLALLNHESSLVLLPGLIYYSWIENNSTLRDKIKIVAAFLIACVPYLLYRWYVSRHAAVGYSLDFYFSRENIGIATKYLFHFLPAAIFYAFKLSWFFPLYLAIVMTREKKFSYPLLIVLMVLSAVLQLVIVFDYTRIISLAFPVILISAEQIRNRWGSEKFVRFSMMLILFNFFILQYYITNDGLMALFPWFYNLFAALCGHPNV